MMKMMWWEPVCHRQFDSDAEYWGTRWHLVWVALPTYQAGKTQREGKDMYSQHDTFRGPTGHHTSQPYLIMVSKASDKTGSFLHNYFVVKMVMLFSLS